MRAPRFALALVGLLASGCHPAAAPTAADGAVPALDGGGAEAERWRRPPSAAAPPWQAPSPVASTLPSGTRLSLLAQAGLQLARIVVVVRAGSALDGERQGLAAATAQMAAVGGAGGRDGDAVASAFAALGDDPEVRVDGDSAQLELTVPPPALADALGLLADVVLRPRFDERRWRRERARRVAELRSAEGEPAAVADRVFRRVHFGDHHPYGHAPEGRAADVAGLQAADLRVFHAAHYHPGAISVILVLPIGGTAGIGEPAALVGAAFAGAPRGEPAPPPPWPSPVAPARPRLVLCDRPGAAQSELRVGGGALARGSPDMPAAMVLDTVLGGSFTSRLVQNLREAHGYAYDVGAAVVVAESAAPLLLTTAVRTDATAAALGEIRGELGRLLREPVGDAELVRARALLHGQLVDGFGDGAGAAHLLADVIAHGVDGAWWSRLEAGVAAVDAPRLRAVAARLCDPEHLTVVVVGDRRRVEAGLRALPGGAALEVRTADGEPAIPGTSRPRAASIK